jgi:phage terminase large subunit GpA-like protein
MTPARPHSNARSNQAITPSDRAEAAYRSSFHSATHVFVTTTGAEIKLRFTHFSYCHYGKRRRFHVLVPHCKKRFTYDKEFAVSDHRQTAHDKVLPANSIFVVSPGRYSQ